MTTDTHETHETHEAPHADAPEPPPRGVFVMAIVRWILLIAMSALAVWAVRKYGFTGQGSAAMREARYYCPMHPQITSPDPGECPICHMQLEPIPPERRGQVGAAAIHSGTTTPAPSQTPPPVAASAPDASMPGMPGLAAATPGAPSTGHEGHQQAAAAAAANAAPTTDGGAPRSVMLSLERRQVIDVATTPVVRRTVQEPMRVPAVVAARENGVSQVHVRSDAFIERVAVRETGVRVGAGEVLAWIYSPAIYRAQQDMFTASRWTSGGDAGISAEAQRMTTAARESLRLLGVAERDVETILRAGAPQRTVPLRATGSGVVTRREAVPGQYATPEMVLYEITDLSRVWVMANVFEQNLPRVHRGDVARVRVNGDPTDVEARVVLVEPSVDPATRTARVRLDVANPGLRWRPGAFGEATFVTPDRNVLAVPRDALIDTGDAQYVFVDAGEGNFEARRVTAGATVDGMTEISSGLREGEPVVVRGGFLIDAESRLRSAVSPGASQ